MTGDRLRDQQAVERIAVPDRELFKGRDVLQPNGQDADREVARGLAEPGLTSAMPSSGLRAFPGGDDA